MQAFGAVNTCPKCSGAGRLAGPRECFFPRGGYVFAQADYPQLELYTLAQCCVAWTGASRLVGALNAGLDPHLDFAASLLGISYDEARKNRKSANVDAARQTAKVANFGFPGGLGIPTLVKFARKTYSVELTDAKAKALKQQWFAKWPEMPRYFAFVRARTSVETLWTKRIRGRVSYCAACNNGFQALGADCAKNAAWLIAKAQYVEESRACSH